MQRNARTCIITQYNRDTHAFIRRRVRVADPDAILQLRLPPPPLPLSWGRAIKPFKPLVVQQVLPQATAGGGAQHAADPASGPNTAAAAAGESGAAGSSPAGSSDAGVAGTSAAAARGVSVPRGLIRQPPALPASRNCQPQVHSQAHNGEAGKHCTAAAVGPAGSVALVPLLAMSGSPPSILPRQQESALCMYGYTSKLEAGHAVVRAALMA